MPEPEESVEPVADETPTPQDDTTPEESSEERAKKPAETVEFWKTKAQEWEKRSKGNDRAAKRLADLEEEQRKISSSWQERAEAAEARIATMETVQQVSDWKSEIAKLPKYAGVSAEVLRGTTYEEIEEHAAQLKALLPEPRKPGSVPGEGRTVTHGTGDPAQQFADLIRNARK